MKLAAEYVLPLRWFDNAEMSDLTAYLRDLSQLIDITVVDGSSEEVFEVHRLCWSPYVRLVGPGHWPGRNGKVRGVMTGLRMARHDAVVIADDDVRYDLETLRDGLRRLDHADLVAPQNVFTDWPWHARWDTARQLVNRALGSDYPGTLIVRRDAVLPGGYDGDVLFENLELMRTVAERGEWWSEPTTCTWGAVHPRPHTSRGSGYARRTTTSPSLYDWWPRRPCCHCCSACESARPLLPDSRRWRSRWQNWGDDGTEE